MSLMCIIFGVNFLLLKCQCWTGESCNISLLYKACENDFDGDGEPDSSDVCPENPDILATDFRNLETMDLCEKNSVDGKQGQCYVSPRDSPARAQA